MPAAAEREEEAKELGAAQGLPGYLSLQHAQDRFQRRPAAADVQTVDAPALMLSTYKALQGGEAAEQLTMECSWRASPSRTSSSSRRW